MFSGAGEVFGVALTRNRFVASLADTVLIAHAQPGSKTEQLAQEVVGWGKQVYTLDHLANEHLLALGAELLTPACQKESCLPDLARPAACGSASGASAEGWGF
jgi:predicted Rossmann fold nucleotide-binding protein DprA/Smf involved in DNA uptake